MFVCREGERRLAEAQLDERRTTDAEGAGSSPACQVIRAQDSCAGLLLFSELAKSHFTSGEACRAVWRPARSYDVGEVLLSLRSHCITSISNAFAIMRRMWVRFLRDAYPEFSEIQDVYKQVIKMTCLLVGVMFVINGAC